LFGGERAAAMGNSAARTLITIVPRSSPITRNKQRIEWDIYLQFGGNITKM